WTCDYEKLLLNMTKMSNEEFKNHKETLNRDMEIMHDIRNYVGVFGENFLLSTVNTSNPLTLIDKIDFIKDKAQEYYKNIQYLKEKYADLYIDLKYFETRYQFD